MQTEWIKIHLSFDPKSKTILGRTSSENTSDGLIRLVREFTKSVTNIISKVQEFKTYNKVINNSNHGNK